MKFIGSPKQFMARQKSIVVIWSISPLLSYHMSQHGNNVQNTKQYVAQNQRWARSRTNDKGEDFPEAVRKLAGLQRQQGLVNPYIQKDVLGRQRPFDERLRSGS